MFWRMTGLSTTSPVETILDKENYTLEELLDEDEIIQECKALNNRLINFLRERTQVEQLVRYIVEEPPEDAEKGRTFKFPFIACEIFTCEVDIILKALVEDDELMNLLFSFLDPEHPHSTQLAGYFSKVVVCLLLRKTVPLMNYIQAHQDIIQKLVDLIGITSIMEVLIRLIGADEHLYTSYLESMQWLEDTDVLEMIVDKFSSSVPNVACSRQTSGTFYIYNRQSPQGSVVTAKPETVEGMLESLGSLLMLLEVSAEENVLLTTYGKLQPPLGKNRLKIVEFISVLMTVSSEAAEKELIRLGALKRILELFFEYPYNNFIHHHIEQILDSCLESKNTSLIQHILEDCHLVKKLLDAEKNCALSSDPKNPTLPAEGRTPPRIGNVGHMTRIANKLIEQGANNSYIQSYLQDVYFDDESAEVVISSLRLGDDQESGSLFTNSNWFAFEEEREIDEQSTSTAALPSPSTDDTAGGNDGGDDVVTSNENDNDNDLVDSATSEVPESKQDLDDAAIGKATDESRPSESDKPSEWIEWREAVEPESSVMTTEPAETSQAATNSLPNGDLEVNSLDDIATDPPNIVEVSPPSSATKPEVVADSGGKTDVG
ncbi:hypothetical protein M8C21_030850, partial [Ambrosia artemisiifolia]